MKGSGLRWLLTNFSWLMAERVFGLTIGLFVSVYVARYLGPERFGILSYAQSLAGLFASMALFGIEGVVVRELIRSPDCQAELLGTAAILRLTGALTGILLLAGTSLLLNNTLEETILVLIIGCGFVVQTLNVIEFYFQSIAMPRYIVEGRLIQLTASSVIKVALVLMAAPLLAFAVMAVVDAILLATALVAFYKHKGTLVRWRLRYETAVDLLRNSWPLVISGVAVSVYMKIDQVMIKELLGVEDVGNYAAAIRVSEAIYFIPMTLAAAVQPFLMKARQRGRESYTLRLRQFYAGMAVLSLVVAFSISASSGSLISLLYGPLYSKSADILTVHVWGLVAVSLGIASSQHLIIANLQGYAAYRTVLGLAVNVALNLVFIPTYGAVGAAWATVVSFTVATFSIYAFSAARSDFTLILRALNPREWQVLVTLHEGTPRRRVGQLTNDER